VAQWVAAIALRNLDAHRRPLWPSVRRYYERKLRLDARYQANGGVGESKSTIASDSSKHAMSCI
jgi:hypothetical protein